MYGASVFVAFLAGMTIAGFLALRFYAAQIAPILQMAERLLARVQGGGKGGGGGWMGLIQSFLGGGGLQKLMGGGPPG